MILAAVIEFTLTNLPSILFVAALVIATVRRQPQSGAERYLTWLLLLAVGVENDGLHHYPASGRDSACPTSGGAPTMRSVASPSLSFATWMAVPG